jgi:hypothetical protein
LQASLNGVWPADHCGGQKVSNTRALLRLQSIHEVFNRCLQTLALSRQDAQNALVGAAGQKLGLGV